jgi:MFS family permease
VEAPDPSGQITSRSGTPRAAALGLLVRNRDFRLLFTALVISLAGDWFLFVALAGLVFDLTGSAVLVAAVFASTTVPFAVFTFVGGPLADRLNRQRLMIGADLVRGLLALGFFLVHDPSDVWLVYVLAGAIAALGAVFEPASSAAVPNLVDGEDLGPATMVTGATWGTMLAVGSALGGLVVALFGREAGYLCDSASFLVSAGLVARIRRPMSKPRPTHHEHPAITRAIRETFRYARQDRRVLALLSVKGGFGLAAGMVGLLPVLAFEVFGAGDMGTGILMGFRGLGVLVGPFLVRRILRGHDLRPVFTAIPVAFATFGLFYAGAAWAPWLVLSGILVMAAHFGGGAQWTMSTYALQRIVPDHFRGRIFGFDYGLVTFTVALSATVGGALAEWIDPRMVMLAMSSLSLAYSIVWTFATAPVRRSLGAEAPGRVQA